VTHGCLINNIVHMDIIIRSVVQVFHIVPLCRFFAVQ
jgi:hypothetical protein